MSKHGIGFEAEGNCCDDSPEQDIFHPGIHLGQLFGSVRVTCTHAAPHTPACRQITSTKLTLNPMDIHIQLRRWVLKDVDTSKDKVSRKIRHLLNAYNPETESSKWAWRVIALHPLLTLCEDDTFDDVKVHIDKHTWNDLSVNILHHLLKLGIAPTRAMPIVGSVKSPRRYDRKKRLLSEEVLYTEESAQAIPANLPRDFIIFLSLIHYDRGATLTHFGGAGYFTRQYMRLLDLALGILPDEIKMAIVEMTLDVKLKVGKFHWLVNRTPVTPDSAAASLKPAARPKVTT
jgi:hypothetical protein